MFFNAKDETILRGNHEESNGALYQTVAAHEKVSLNNKVRESLDSWTQATSTYVRWSDRDVDAIDEAMSRAPMICNFLMSRGYKSILYVGHFSGSQTHWTLDKFAGRLVDLLPPERADHHSFPDPNIVAQFTPLIHANWMYNAHCTIVRPPEGEHQGAMWDIYEQCGALTRGPLAFSNMQYRHGIQGWELDLQMTDLKFDAVVFMGVPQQDPSTGFEEDEVRETFAPYCEENFDLIDIYYGAPSPSKWHNGEEKDVSGDLDTVFSTRAVWDEDVKTGGSRPEEKVILERMIKVY